MKFSYQWIRDFVSGLDMRADELERLITVRTAECDGIHRVGELLRGARVARVLRAETVSGTHITKAVVDVGAPEPITVACGAPNCREGLHTVWVPVGRKTIQGVESNGMLASANELGIGREDEGIIEWADASIALEPDQVIEIDNKSLTHRPDLWGHEGMAREVAAITKSELKDLVDLSLLPTGRHGFDVTVEDTGLCPRFSALVFENVKVAPSPYWLQYRLISVGMNPISNIVDITNYVAAELAQPMHAFDRDKLKGDRLIVRTAREGATVLALDGNEYTLSADDGVVCDEEGPVGIAAIIGGNGSAVSSATENVVFESANWNASRVRKTSARLKLRTDASMRFEKSQDPANTVRALARTVALMKIVCPGARLVGGLTDIHTALPQPSVIVLNLDVLDRKLGRAIPQNEVVEILERLEFRTQRDGARKLRVTVPSWRATKDIAVPDDLVEEVGRMVGYDTITPAPPRVECTPPPDDPQRGWLRELCALMTGNGYTEVYNYSFLSDPEARRFGFHPEDAVRVLNPIASDQNVLRQSLIPGIFSNLELNRKHFDTFRLFEIGREIHNRAPEKPREILHLAAAVYGDEKGLFELKRMAEAAAPGIRVHPVQETKNYEHPARTAELILADSNVGRLFEAHPQRIEGRASILDLNLDLIWDARGPIDQYRQFGRYPSSAFDLTIVAPARLYASRIEDHIREYSGPLVERVEYLRQFEGADGTKSVTYRITVGAQNRTLSSAEINAVRAAVIDKLQSLGYGLKV